MDPARGVQASAYGPFSPPRVIFFNFLPYMPSRVDLFCLSDHNQHIRYHFNYNPGTFSDVDGHRQPSQVELDIAKHQATCVACTVVRA